MCEADGWGERGGPVAAGGVDVQLGRRGVCLLQRVVVWKTAPVRPSVSVFHSQVRLLKHTAEQQSSTHVQRALQGISYERAFNTWGSQNRAFSTWTGSSSAWTIIVLRRTRVRSRAESADPSRPNHPQPKCSSLPRALARAQSKHVHGSYHRSSCRRRRRQRQQWRRVRM